MGLFGGKRPQDDERAPDKIGAEWQAADDAGDAARAGELAEEMTQRLPESFMGWFQAGLYSKARRDWVTSLERNRRADQLYGERQVEEFEGVNPAAWNLAIAATALGDWATARYAWTRFGVSGLAEGEGPIDASFGTAPIRLNPDRPSLPHQVLPDFGVTEVVWCRRLSPAHAVIVSVPMPESGHRFGDVLLHDGEPKGSRRLGGAEVSVFDEIERLESSGTSTWQVAVENAGQADWDAVGEIAYRHEVGADDWSSMRMLCSDCSHGPSDPAHHHPPAVSDTLRLGLAGSDHALAQFLEEWASGRPHLTIGEAELLW
ncbi:hypothetical protein [Aeromicrobium sp. Leaf350]|uniref:hypothetical protein n=1 Tax=Aeromicrobium sp. Leaf350 TaxID=2876565 RepID=UPI001E36FD3F|nr:hypothetical protein [Aeromicrobium sp. Leaf350]